ncbi:hypothetical protein [Companilactobacillus mishanensis]|uniref:Matrixin family metalloprotease n=1 Tax=Companilactobacillus mishanensis TaxID=2486008 RepID=A0A5P0ZIU7_9LACO|nr:hypothetical protein [Companilactobacillus mishanensis]MQS53019.1 hypothetical protein [Companilactobacillus mishanensis]
MKRLIISILLTFAVLFSLKSSITSNDVLADYEDAPEVTTDYEDATEETMPPDMMTTDEDEQLGQVKMDDLDNTLISVAGATFSFADETDNDTDGSNDNITPAPMPQTGGSAADIGLGDKSNIKVYCSSNEVGTNIVDSLQTAVRNWSNSLGEGYVCFQFVNDKNQANIIISGTSLANGSKEDGYTDLTDVVWTTGAGVKAYKHARIQLSNYVKSLNANNPIQVHVLMHELGHALGFVDLGNTTQYRNNGVIQEFNTRNDVMYGKTNSCTTVTDREVMEFQTITKAIWNR